VCQQIVAIDAVAARYLVDAVVASHINGIVADFCKESVSVYALVLTPTLHRLFDAGLFTLCISRGQVRVKRHPKLAESVLSNPERGTIINLKEGMALLTPRFEEMQPMRQFVEFHSKNIYGKAG
jgi:hypothetical protein